MSANDVGYFCVVHEREATKPVTISGDALATANFTTRTGLASTNIKGHFPTFPPTF